MRTNAVILSGVGKSFGDRRVLRDVSLVFSPGSVTALMGASGSGKTTLLHILLGLIQPDAGTITGLEPDGSAVRLAAVFQEDRLIEHRSAAENVRLVCPGPVSDAQIEEHLRAVGMAGEKSRVSAFSGGMRRRVALVRALIVRPDLLVLDEPFKGLDVAIRLQCAEYIARRRGNATLIVATHDPEEAKLLGVSAVLQLS